MLAKGEVPELLIVQNKNKTAVGRHADQTEPRQRIPMYVHVTDWKPAQTAGRFSHGTRGSGVTVGSVQRERIERFTADLPSEKCSVRQADLQTLPEVVAFVIYL